MEGDLGAGGYCSSSSSTPAPTSTSASASASKMSAAEEASATNNSNSINSSNSLWGSLLERSSTAPPMPTEFEAWGATSAAAGHTSAGADTGPDHAGGGGGASVMTSAPTSGGNSSTGSLLLGGGGTNGSISGAIIPPRRPKTTEPSLHFIDEYSGGGVAGGGGAGSLSRAAGGSGSSSGNLNHRLPPGLGGPSIGMTAASSSSSSSSGNLATAVAAGAGVGGTSNTNNSNAAAALERQFLFEAGSGIRRPASTGIVLGGAGGHNHHDSLTLSGAGVASAEVLKSLGLEIPGYTSSASNNHGIGLGGGGTTGGGGGNNGGGGNSIAQPNGGNNNNGERRSSLGRSTTGDGRGTPSSKSGSALMDLIQEEMRSGRASAVSATATPAPLDGSSAAAAAMGENGNNVSRSASTAPGPGSGSTAATVAGSTVDDIGGALQNMQVGGTANGGSAAAGTGTTNRNQTQNNQIRYEPASQYSPLKQQQAQYNHHQQQPRYQQHQRAIYHQPSPVFTGMNHHNSSPPEFYLGGGMGGGGAPVSPHAQAHHQMYGHQPPSAVAASAVAGPGQYGQPAQPQQQPQQQPTVYYTQGPNGQTQAIYVNAPQPPPAHAQYGMAVPPPPPPPPPHGYGYATIQYHAGPPPPHHQGGQPHQPHQQQQQVIHINANGQPVQTAPPATAYAYYPSTGQYAPVTTTAATATAPGGQPVILAAAGPGGYHHPHQYPSGASANANGGGGGGGGSPRRYHQNNQGLGGSRHGRRSNNGRGMDGSGHSGGGGGGGGGRNRANTGSSAASGPTNPILEEFRNNKTSASTWTVADIRGHVVAFCRDQNGSRFIQQRLEVAPPSEKDMVMEEVMAASGGGLTALCGDVFGNYVVQKLLEVGDDKMLEDIMQNALKGEMMNLSMQMYGCRVVQKSFERLPCKHFPTLLDEFKNDVVACIHDANGNHVMQKIVESLSNKAKIALKNGDATTGNFFRDCIQFIIDDILKNIAPLSCHPYGCRVLQRILEHCVEPQKSDILDALLTCHKMLLDEQYGNYVIQHVLQYGRVQDRQSLLGIIVAGGILTLSRQKFASNVVEKLLKYGNQEQRAGVVRAMLQTVHDDSIPSVSPGGTPIVILMVRDAYANYVVQTAIDVSVDPERRELLNVLNANVMMLRQYTFAKHIVAKLGS